MKFRSPKYEEVSVLVPDEAARMNQSFNGTVCSKKGDEYKIDHNIIDFLDDKRPEMSLAQRSSQWTLTSKIYEKLWRSRSLSILSDESFPIEREQELLVNWINPQPGNTYLDVGCSTALYARTIKNTEPKCKTVALDISKQMLQEARVKAKTDQTDLYLLRADARFMPFYASAFDGLVMGGTLNELSDPLKVLYECRRILKKSGILFMMHLTKAESWYSRLLQNATQYSGLKFWNITESSQLFKRAGFSVNDQYAKGIVCFSKLKPI